MIEVNETGRDHQHAYVPAGILAQSRKHVVTQVVMQRPSLVMLCPCGDIQHKWVPDPGEDEEGETKAPIGGILHPFDGQR